MLVCFFADGRQRRTHSLSLTHTHTLSLSLSLTHTHTHSVSQANLQAMPSDHDVHRSGASKKTGSDGGRLIDELRAEVRRLETDKELLSQDARRARANLDKKEKTLLAMKRELVNSLKDLESEFRGVAQERDDLEQQLQHCTALNQQVGLGFAHTHMHTNAHMML